MINVGQLFGDHLILLSFSFGYVNTANIIYWQLRFTRLILSYTSAILLRIRQLIFLPWISSDIDLIPRPILIQYWLIVATLLLHNFGWWLLTLLWWLLTHVDVLFCFSLAVCLVWSWFNASSNNNLILCLLWYFCYLTSDIDWLIG